MIFIVSLAACLDLEKGSDTGDGGSDGWDGWDVWGDEGETGVDAEPGEPVGFPPDFSVEWMAEGIYLHVGSSSLHWLGMAETGCDVDPNVCWYGEDCVYGDMTGTYFYCHTLSSSAATLQYGGDYSSLDEESETVFTSPAQADTVTYYMESSGTGACWTWGHDPSYYAGLGCEEL